MTPRNVIAVDFREIPSIEVRCKCGAITSMPLPKTGLPPHFDCVGCNAVLWYAEMEGGPYSKVLALVKGISAWQQVEAAPFTLGFSLDASDRASCDKAN